MQPVRMILKAIEISERRRATGLVVAQAEAIGREVPLQRPGAHRQPCTGLLTVTVVHGVQDPIQMIMHPIHRVRRACRLGTGIGRGEGHGKRTSSAGQPKELGEVGKRPAGPCALDFQGVFAGIPRNNESASRVSNATFSAVVRS